MSAAPPDRPPSAADVARAGSTLSLSLISHTNAGKTTLARTLLGRDIGEVRDEAHVTFESELQLIRKLREDYPGVEPYLKQGIAVAIDGVLYRDNWSRELPSEGEVFVLPRMAGG